MMSRMLKVSLYSVFALAIASQGVAYAQDPVEGEEGGTEGEGTAEGTEGEAAAAEGEGAAEGDAAAGDAAMGGGQMIGPFTKESYPMELIFRPLTLVKGMIEVRGSLEILRFFDTTSIGLALSAGYGITDKLEVGVGSGFNIDPDAGWGEFLSLYGAFSVIDQDKLDVAPSVSTSLSFVEGGDTFTGLTIGANTRFLINDKIFVRGGQDLINLNLNPETGARLNLNVGGGFQVNPNLAVTLDLALASVKLFGDAEADTTFFDPLGITLSGLYAINNKLDVYLKIALPSISDAGDYQQFSIGANFRI